LDWFAVQAAEPMTAKGEGACGHGATQQRASSSSRSPFLKYLNTTRTAWTSLASECLAIRAHLTHEQRMNSYSFTFAGAALEALNTGALWWSAKSLLCVSDLHLGKSERIARLGGSALPPYETRDTLDRLSMDIERTGARCVICLGDSFDDLGAALALPAAEKAQITQMQAGRLWVWIEGNHDPGPTELGGNHLNEMPIGPLTFRHIAQPSTTAEVSGHYHPKTRIAVRGRAITRPAFLVDDTRIIMPAYGTYTGGLECRHPTLRGLMADTARAIMTGQSAIAVPMPR
jgi:DNA ligase-associated metallophosphoesterase